MASDQEVDYEQLVIAQNRKRKKPGGWQVLERNLSGLDHAVYKGIMRKGYKQPTPIQRKGIPQIIDGKDLVAMSRTGSGKTAAFVIPMLQRLKIRDVTGIRALIIEPTRELAIQTTKVIRELGKFTDLKCANLVGGDLIEEQFAVLHGKPDILVATPGRLLHVIVEMNVYLSAAQYLVFDEADRLFEMGFSSQLQEILKRLPSNRQTLLFSATLPKMLVDFTKAGLTDPVLALLVRLDVDEKLSDKLSMVFLSCRADEKISAFLHLMRLVIEKSEQTIVFCSTMKHVEYLSCLMKEAGMDCVHLYSQLDPTARKINMHKFRRKECLVLIVTDIAARGVDIPILDTVINFDFPPKAKLFVHRVGRVARVERSGKAISLFTYDELPYLVDLFLYLGRPINFAQASSTYKGNEALVGHFPDRFVELSADFLKNVHENSDDMVGLQKKMNNAMKKYIRTRPHPSAESVRRTKRELGSSLRLAADHPFLTESDGSLSDKFRQEFLQQLSCFKPQTTIFEFQSGSKSLSAAVMKEKRRKHGKFIQKADKNDHGEVSEAMPILDASEDISPADNLVDVFDKTIKSSKNSVPSEASRLKRKRRAEEIAKEKQENYIAYAPQDAAFEKGLAVDRGFHANIRANTIEFAADDDVGLYKQSKRKKWDRKLKRFVGESDDSVKKIRTEDGTLLPATYRSGRYERWQNKQKIHHLDSDKEDTDVLLLDKTRNKKFAKGRRGSGSTSKTKHKNGLRNKDQILKERIRKQKVMAYQSYRKKQNLRKKRH